MKYRQRKKVNTEEEWTRLASIRRIWGDNISITFACATDGNEGANVSTQNYATLKKWLVSCSIDEEIFRLRTMYLDIEIYPEEGETLEQLKKLKDSIDSIVNNEESMVSKTTSSEMRNGPDEEQLIRLQSRCKRLLELIEQQNQFASTWAERVVLASRLGENDLAREAHSKQENCENEIALLEIELQVVQEQLNEVEERNKKEKEALLEGISYARKSKNSSPSKTVEIVMQEIEELIGLENIKQEVRSLVNSLRVNQMRESAGLPSVSISRHMVFYGNPGTGKTTIARRLGELFYLLGILPKGHFIETDRSSLVGGYLGQTAIKTSQVLDSALGGILFIDEAYTLSQSESGDQFGQEAIDTLLKFMEDHRDEIVIIVAGYENLMDNFLESNPGLKSRFNKYFHFQDYTEVELSQIFMAIAQESNYELDEEAQNYLIKIAGEMKKIKTKNFGNGRTVRNLFERSIANQANRIIRQNITSKDELARLTKEDILWEDVLAVSR